MIIYLIYNIFNLGCFTTLAIVFNKWWIIFFALLFILVPTRKVMHKRTCDICGKSTKSCDTTEEAIKEAERCGWIHIDKTDSDFCPECVHKIRGEKTFNEVDYKR